MTLHARQPVLAHYIAMPTAAANSPALSGGFCAG
jgi:hypothetical protein